MPAIAIDARLLDAARKQQQRMRAIGRKGGRATVAKLGREHMRSIGAKGFMATLARHWQGDRSGMLAWLREHARYAMADALADLEIARQLDGGKSIACCELPY